jgi:hypothetical protein
MRHSEQTSTTSLQRRAGGRTTTSLIPLHTRNFASGLERAVVDRLRDMPVGHPSSAARELVEMDLRRA